MRYCPASMRASTLRLGVALALIAPLIFADVPDNSSGQAIVIRGAPVPLHPDDATLQQIGRLRYRAGLHLTSDWPSFGGFSGLVIDGASRQLTAISDQGHWLTATLDLTQDGTLVGLTEGRMDTLCDDDGEPVAVWERRDAEEIQLLPGKGFVVSFERHHRLAFFPWSEDGQSPLNGRPQPFPFPPGIIPTLPNKGMEAVALLPDGRLLTFAEELRTITNDIIGWIGHPNLGDWRLLTLSTREDFLPTGAAVLPSGDVLLLERSFHKSTGNRIRLSILKTDQLQPDSRLEPIELALIEPPATTDNMEAVAIHQGPGGETLIYLMSDNNFSDVQRTLLLQFELLQFELQQP